MMIATAQISESLQILIDSRLDTIDRMLLGRLPRQERLAIVTEVESQIYEQLQASDAEELTREDVLAVLARLDPPEAYVPDEIDSERVSMHTRIPKLARQTVSTADRVARASAMLGVSAIALVLLLPVDYLMAVALNSSDVAIMLYFGTLLLMIISSVLGIAFGIIARKSGLSAIVGIVTGSLALFLSLALAILGILVA